MEYILIKKEEVKIYKEKNNTINKIMSNYYILITSYDSI